MFTNRRVALLSTQKLHVDLVHRPASSNIGVKASVDQLDMTGWSSVDGKEDAPVIITTKKEVAGMFMLYALYYISMHVAFHYFFLFTSKDDHLLDVEFDLNPLKGEEEKQKVDHRIRLKLLPVEVVYDAVSA